MSTRSRTLQPKDWAARVSQYIHEARHFGIQFKPPSVNDSLLGFRIKDGNVYFGLKAIRGVGVSAARSIIRGRRKQSYSDVFDFILRSKSNKGVFESLVKAGAFDTLGYHRSELLAKSEEIYTYTDKVSKYAERIQDYEAACELFKEVAELCEERDNLRSLQKASQRKRNPGPALTHWQAQRLAELEEMKLRRRQEPNPVPSPEDSKPTLARSRTITLSIPEIIEEANYVGCYINMHPAHIVFPNNQKIQNLCENDYIRTTGVVNSIKNIVTKRGQPMAFLEMSDETGIAEVIVFPNTYSQLKADNLLPEAGQIIRLDGKCEAVEPVIKIIANRLDIYRG